MKTPSTESFHSTRSRPSCTSESPPPPETTSHKNDNVGMPLSTTLTTHYVGQLNNQCQTLGISACYKIYGDQQIGFGGYLQLGPHTITMDERWPSKKAAREGLAPKGLAIVKALQSKKTDEVISAQNWVGMINTFHQKTGQTDNGIGPIFTEYTIGSHFACTCLISLHPTPFGSESVGYTSKKAARANAAREAMKFLISSGYATPDGKPLSTIKSEKSLAPAGKKGKKSGLKNGASVDAITTVVTNTDATFAQKVNELCPLLGLNCPQYRLQATGSSLYSGSAYFPDEPLLQGPIGEVEYVFGKKNAKEESARGVWKELMALAELRGLIGGETDDEGAVALSREKVFFGS